MHSPRQIYFAKLRDHAIPFFINKIKLPPSTVFLLLLFSYLMYMYDVHAKTVPTNLETFVKIGKNITIIRDYQQSNVSLPEKGVFH